MADNKFTMDHVRDYKPSKAVWFWSCVASVVATIAVGFSYGGWVTGGTARDMVDEASTGARAQLASDICVYRFSNSADFGPQLAALKEERSWSRDSFIEDGGWATLAGMTEPVADAAELCADELAAMDAPTTEATTTEAGSTVQ
ncbi:hypothetical protein [Marinivivus vitaminiproducens]|uniref:hypothetical protein n=1 Tax=Marinivivus vitaminiproducens TaxID=3035935 RepID=UPI0027A242A6|nr:hypothetical protein P4R82_06750 [Geminicoccaceae bacterium SCSIO 64248]